MQNNILLLIIGMSFVTFISRLIPFMIMGKFKFSKNGQTFLNYIPYAALGALIFPDSFTAVKSMPMASIIGTIVAFILSLFVKNITLVVIGTIAATYGIILLV
jgi:branched-subunit amino acid transport protein